MGTSFLKKIIPFFTDGIKIENPSDVLELPFTSLKAWDPEWASCFEDLGLVSIKDLAQSEEPLVSDGLDPEALNQLAMIAEMIFWKITQIMEGDQKKKVVFFGLGNAGKTSALTALSEKYSSIKELLPTRGLERQNTDILGYNLMAFDFGGQSEYRDQYFEKADMYFSSADMMVYLIDIQDTEKYPDSLAYLQRILDAYTKFELFLPILIVFSKMDPDVAKDENLSAHRIKLINEIENMAPKFDVGFVNSSIYERNSIENLFSLVLKRISTSGAVIQELMKTFTKDIGARACTLISSTGLVFGSYGETHKEEEMLNNSAQYLQNLYLFHLTTGIEKEDFYELKYTRNNLHFISEYIKTLDSGMVYLWVLTGDLRSEVLGLPKFREELLPLIDLFL
jgi:small GTP-binding protein